MQKIWPIPVCTILATLLIAPVATAKGARSGSSQSSRTSGPRIRATSAGRTANSSHRSYEARSSPRAFGRTSSHKSSAGASALKFRVASPPTETASRTTSAHTARSTSQREAFQRSHPCPSTGRTSGACPGYVVDHVVPLKRGGADSPSNMRWQTTEAAKAKDRVE